MVKRKKHTGSGGAFDNPLAAARSGKATAKLSSVDQKNNKDPSSSATDWVEFGGKSGKASIGNSKEKTSSKAIRKAEQIWHRRSGAGFHLFVDYYLGQPDGIVVASSNDNDDGKSATPIEIGPTAVSQLQPVSAPSTGGAGQSRAALRRKKKKRRKSSHGSNPGEVAVATEPSGTNDASLLTAKPTSAATAAIHPPQHWTHDQLLYSGRLLDVLSSRKATKPNGFHSDFRDFLTALSKPLPLTFRFRRYEAPITSNNKKDGNRNIDDNTLPHMFLSHSQRKRRIQKIAGLRRILEGPTLARSNVRPVFFDPNSNVYQAMAPPELPLRTDSNGAYRHPFPLDKACLKRLCPQLKDFLNEHTSDGTLARQELGSILPVWLLETAGAFSTRRLRVLDTCASPGSKTLQVAELASAMGRGRVRANDVNASRLESLRDALERSGFFGSSEEDESSGQVGSGGEKMDSLVRFSNADASRYPIPKTEALKYSVILCDVPCSGDGTCRKDVHVIPNWTPAISNALHSLQVQILLRALRCVAVGGTVSYSTCSLNPIEDEAVVRAALESHTAEGTLGFELVEVPEASLNGLVLRKGVQSWRVADYDPSSLGGNPQTKTNQITIEAIDDKGEEEDASSDGGDNNNDDEETLAELRWHDSYRGAVESGMEGARESMWPREVDGEKPVVPLHRCLRLLPQDQDTGGFFVALIRRTK